MGGFEQVIYDLATTIDREKYNLSVIVVDKCGVLGERLKEEGINVIEVRNNIDSYVSELKKHGFDIINTHYSGFGIDKASELNIPVIATIHSNYVWLSPEEIKEFRRMDTFVHKYIAVSNQVKNYYRRKINIPPGKIEVIPNGLNIKDFNTADEADHTREYLGYRDNDFIFLHVGAFNRLKNHHLMLTAIQELAPHYPEMKMVFVGHKLSHGLYEEITDRIHNERLEDSVRVIDFVKRSILKDFYIMSDIFIQPSISEGFSITALEAMYFSLPLILTDVGSARDIMKNNDIGLIIPNPYREILDINQGEVDLLSDDLKYENLEDLKLAMVDMYENRKKWREKAQKGREKIHNIFNIENTAREYENQFIHTVYITKKSDVNELNTIFLKENKVRELLRLIKNNKKRIQQISDQGLSLQNELKAKSVELDNRGARIQELSLKIKELESSRDRLKITLAQIYDSKTWKLGQFYGKLLFHTRINRVLERLINTIIQNKNNRQKTTGVNPRDYAVEDEVMLSLKNLISMVNRRKQKGVFVVTSSFEFDEFYNQRAINLSKFLADSGNTVLYIAWRWSKDDYMKRICQEVYPNIFNVPVDYLFDHYPLFCNILHEKKYFFIELPHPKFFHIMLHLRDAGFTGIYDIADDWEEFYRVGQAPWFEKDHESATVINADVVTAVSRPLIEKFSHLRTDISLIPNGYSPSFLGEISGSPASAKKDGKNIDIGYFGHLTDSWFDWDSVIESAKKNKDFIFHIIGYGESEKARSRALRYDNIRLYGKVHPSELRRYTVNWDVAVLPFKISALSNAVDPIKIYEYLYFRLPTATQGLEHLNNIPYVKNCSTPDELRDAITDFAAKKINSKISYRKIEEFLNECTWEKRFSCLLSLLGRSLI
jgi:glycosyltransferase involved in cell wall biosynthesis